MPISLKTPDPIKKHKKYGSLILAGLVLLTAGCAGTNSPVSLQNLEKDTGNLAIPVPGKITVLDFWASWCEPCKKAMPHLEELWQRQDPNRVAFIGVNMDETREAAFGALAEVARVREVTFPMVWDNFNLAQDRYRIGTLPAMVIFDQNGRVAWAVGGGSGNSVEKDDPAEVAAKVEREIEKLKAR